LKKFRDCMNGQWGWNRAAKKCGSSGGHVGQSGSKVGLSGCKVDHHGLLFPRGPCALTGIVFFFPSLLFPSSPPLAYPFLGRLEIVLGSYVISLKSFNIIVIIIRILIK